MRQKKTRIGARTRSPEARVSSIRTIAICVFRHGSRILVANGVDDEKQQSFFRPLGGEVEFGEHSVDALRREIREELGVEIAQPVKLGVLENVFTYRGRPSHEVVFVFDARFADDALYAEERIPIREPVWDGPARWIDLRKPLPGPLFPDGLLELLE